MQSVAIEPVERSSVRSDSGPSAGEAIHPLNESAINNLVRVLQMFADGTRLKILIYLANYGELHVKALCDSLEYGQPAVSHHLALLRAEGLISVRRQGKRNYYRLNHQNLGDAIGGVMCRLQLDERSAQYVDQGGHSHHGDGANP